MVTGSLLEPIRRASVEACIERKTLGLAFPPPLEALFEQETGEERCQHLIYTGVFGIGILQLLLLPLWLIIGDIFPRVLFVQLCITTPLSLAILSLLRLRPRPLLRELCIVLVTMIAIVSDIYLAWHSQSPDRWLVPQLYTLPFLYVTSMQRLRFTPAIVACMAMVLADLVLMAGLPLYDTRAFAACALILLGSSVFALYGTYVSERQMRLAYLLSLRERLQNRELDRMSSYDPLTGLGNRRLMAEVMARKNASAEPLSVILLDIDHFKKLNDTAGHLAGDQCLIRLAAVLREELAEDADYAFRYGGEEFVLFLRGGSPTYALALAERIRMAIEALGLANPGLGPQGRVTISLGVATRNRGEGTSAEALVGAADAALYAAKAAGRNRVWVQEEGATDLVAVMARTMG